MHVSIMLGQGLLVLKVAVDDFAEVFEGRILSPYKGQQDVDLLSRHHVPVFGHHVLDFRG